jgi:CHAT domain-containing protein/tetratricopeptide (TPR) repeat protein
MRSLKTIYLAFIISALLIFVHSESTQAQNIKKFNKYLEKAEKNFEKNKFEKAIKFTHKLEDKSQKKLGPENRFVAVAKLKRAKYNWALGKFNNFYQLNSEALAISEKINGKESIGHGLNLLDATNNMMLYGNFLKANDFIEQVLPIFSESSAADELYLADLYLKKAEILLALGDYNEALNIINDKESFYLQRSLKSKSEKLSNDEEEARYEDVARWITLKSNALRLRGEFLRSDSAFVFGENWIKDKLGKRSKYFTDHLFYFAQMLEENGTNELPASYFKDAYIYSLSALGDIHPFTLRNLEKLVINSINDGNSGKASAYYKDLEKILKANFDKSSTHFVKLASISFESDLRQGKVKKIESQAKKLLADANILPIDHPDRITIYNTLVKVAGARNDYEDVQTYLETIIDIKSKLYGENSNATGFAKLDLANHLVDNTDKFDEALQIYDKVYFGKIENQITSGHMKYVDMLNHLAKNYQFNDNYKLASQLLDEALTVTRVKYDNQDIDFGKELNLIADLQIKIGEYEKADKNLQESLSILENFDNDVNIIYYVKALETSARLLTIKGFYDEAQDAIEEAQKLFKKAIPSPEYNPINAEQELASVYLEIGQYTDADEVLTRAIAKNKEVYGPESLKLINPLVDYGRLQLIKGNYTEAEQNARKALAISEKAYGENSTKNTPATLLLGELYEAIGDFEKSEEYYSKAIATLQNQFGRSHVDVATTISRLAIAKFYGGDKDYDNIEKLLFESKDIIGKRFTVLSPLYADLLKDLSTFFISQGKLEDALSFLDQSQKIWESKAGRRNNIKAADIHILRGDVYYRQSKYRDAEKEYRNSRKLNEKFFNDKHPEYVKATSRLSKVYYMDGDFKNAKSYIEEVIENYNNFIEEYFPALSEREKTKYWNTIRGDFDFYNTMAMRLYDDYPEMIESVYNNTLKTKGLLLSSSIKMRERILNSPDSLLRIKYFNWLNKKETLSKAISMNSEQLVQNDINLSDLAKEVELIEKELSQKSELFGKDIDKEEYSWEQVKDKLQPNEVAIEMVRYRYFNRFLTDSVIYVMLILKNEKKSKPSFVVLNDGNDLESKYFNNYRNSIKYRIKDRYSYQKYWKPIENAIGKNVTLYLSPDGVFNQINLEAIPLDSGKYLIDNSNIILVSNTKELILHDKTTPSENLEQKTALLFGDPKFYLASKTDYVNEFRSGATQVSELPGTRLEIEALTKLFKDNGWETADYMELTADENQVKEMRSPAVFHIATHGFFSDEERKADKTASMTETSLGNSPLLKSGLMLKGAGDVLAKTKFNFNIEPGILTAYEAMNLNLDKTDLVVLSACETGLGEVHAGEGVYGLQRSFLVAGAKTLIMSLFKVSDEATQKLMVSFYRKWLETGNKRQAFIDAKKEIRNEYKDPIYWGAFVMIGLE